jgi:hypothetical protein
MGKNNKTSPHLAQARARAAQGVTDHLGEHCILPAAPVAAAREPVRSSRSLRASHDQRRRAAGDAVARASAEKARIKDLEREPSDLRRASQRLKTAQARIAQAKLDRAFGEGRRSSVISARASGTSRSAAWRRSPRPTCVSAG